MNQCIVLANIWGSMIMWNSQENRDQFAPWHAETPPGKAWSTWKRWRYEHIQWLGYPTLTHTRDGYLNINGYGIVRNIPSMNSNSLTWIKAIWGWFLLLITIPSEVATWGCYDLPKYSPILLEFWWIHIYPHTFSISPETTIHYRLPSTTRAILSIQVTLQWPQAQPTCGRKKGKHIELFAPEIPWNLWLSRNSMVIFWYLDKLWCQPNFNPGFINPGWWIVVVPADNRFIGYWNGIPKKQPGVYQSGVDIRGNRTPHL